MRAKIRKKWKPRRPEAHKGDFGRVLVVAGSRGLAGAAQLTALAALRAGAGLVTLGVPDAVYSMAARFQPEIMVRPFPSTRKGTLSKRALKNLLAFSRTQDVVAAGPGLSRNPETQALVRHFILQGTKPLILDADALNALQGHAKILAACRGRAILTPHPAEFVRVFGGRVPKTEAERKKRAAQAARISGVIVVLKGRRTVVASPDGKVFVNTTGNPGMATGGTGDILTGILAALAGQGFSLWDSACFGVYLHGLAGDLAARDIGQVSLIAGDLLDYLPQALRKTLGF